jgi:hypothetical protein
MQGEPNIVPAKQCYLPLVLMILHALVGCLQANIVHVRERGNHRLLYSALPSLVVGWDDSGNFTEGGS